MSSVLRFTKEPPRVSQRYTVFPYYGIPLFEYYFTVNNDTLYRIEADLSGNGQWVVARDMGKDVRITDVDPEIKEYWENNNFWTNIEVIRPGVARKFQALAIPVGNINGSDNNGPTWNAAAYTDPTGDMGASYYGYQLTGINDLLIMGNDSTTINNLYNQNLPFATFYAVTDPLVIRYENGGSTYTRAIVNRVIPS